MAQLTQNTNWEKSFTLTKQNNSVYTLSTSCQYVDRNIKLTMNVRSATAVASAGTADATLYTDDGSNAGINIAGVIGTKAAVEPNDGYYIAITASGSGGASITQSGWINTGNLSTAPGSEVKYFPITQATLGSDGSVTTNPVVTVSNSTTMITTNENTGYSFTINSTATYGIIQTKYKAITAGYTPIVPLSYGNTMRVTPTITGDNNTTINIQAAAGTISLTSGGSSCSMTTSTNVIVADTDSQNSGVAVTFSGTGEVLGSAAITTEGYAPTTLSFSGDTSFTCPTTTATKYIQGVTLTTPNSGQRQFSITVPNGNGDITFVFHVYANGDVLVDDTIET